MSPNCLALSRPIRAAWEAQAGGPPATWRRLPRPPQDDLCQDPGSSVPSHEFQTWSHKHSDTLRSLSTSKLPHTPRLDLQALLSTSSLLPSPSRAAALWPVSAPLSLSVFKLRRRGGSRVEQRDPRWEGGALLGGPGG